MSQVRQILNDSVMLHCDKQPTRLQSNLTISQALQALRDSPPTSRILYLYVVEDSGKLVGVLPTRRLFQSPAETPLAEIMIRKVIAIPSTATVLDACEFFTFHKLLAFPVTDEESRLVGSVDVELYTDELSDLERREGNDALFQLIGVHLSDAEQAKTGLAFRRRFPWLLCNVAGGLLAAVLADIYSDVSTLIVVAPFIPIVLALAESVSIQSVSLALQTLQAHQPSWRELLSKFTRELLVGLLLGSSCGLIVGVIAWAWKGQFAVAASLFLGISGAVTCAAGIGLALPYLMRLLRKDPRVAAGPIALAFADMVCLFLYFNLGRWLLT